MADNNLKFQKDGQECAIEAAYAVLITLKDSKPHILLSQRHTGGAWEVGFGGAPDTELDRNADDTALREMCEELGQAISIEDWASNTIRLFVEAKHRKIKRDGWFWIRVIWVPSEEMDRIIAGFTPNDEVQDIKLVNESTLADDRTGIIPMQFSQFSPFIATQMVMISSRH